MTINHRNRKLTLNKRVKLKAA